MCIRDRAVIALEKARAYKSEVVNAAQGEAARFESLLTEYQKAPEITKERLYIESLESVLSNSSKVMIGTGESGNNLMYLPIDKLMGSGAGSRDAKPMAPGAADYITPPASQLTPGTSGGNRSRSRGGN